MQEYGGSTASQSGEYRDGGSEGIAGEYQQPGQHQFSGIQQKNYGYPNKDHDPNMATYCRVATGIYEATSSSQQCQNPRYNPSAPSFSSPPHSPLVGLIFDPLSPNYSSAGMGERKVNLDRRAQSSWSVSNLEPIGTGAKKKIVKSQEKRNAYSADPRYHEKYKSTCTETERQRKQERKLTSESTSSLDFFAEGERMVSELCNITDSSAKNDPNNQKQSLKGEDKNKPTGPSEALLTALDKIIIHDQIPNQIVQLAIEACTDAENIAIAHHNRPCFKNIHSICAKTRSNVQKPDSAVANLHSQGIPWVIKNFIFSFVRILDGWKGVKELLSEKHDTFSRIENKYYSPNIRECFVQWQAVTKEMLTHIYKTFKCLDHGFTMEQKSFTHNYYSVNSAAPRHQHQNKYQPTKSGTPRHQSPQPFNAMQPPWVQNQAQTSLQNLSDSPWSTRSTITYKKFPVVPPPNSHNFYPLKDQNEIDYQKAQYKCDPCSIRESKPRQSWTITNMSEFRALESMCHAEQRELYAQLKHKMDAELGKAPGQPIMGNMPLDLLQRREMELKAKMIPLSHVEKTLIPSMAASDLRGFVQKNNSCGDTKEDDFFATWGQMIQKEPSDFITHHSHNIQIPSNIVALSSNISGPVQFIDPENDEFHEMSKVYMKPGSYKVPIKPSDPAPTFVQGSQEVIFDKSVLEDMNAVKAKPAFTSVTLAPQPKFNLESWPCFLSRRSSDNSTDEQNILQIQNIPCLNMRTNSLDILNSLTSDSAWEAAKQSAPKLMDFLNEGTKSDAARLYDALGLSFNDDYIEEHKHAKVCFDTNDVWRGFTTNQLISKDLPNKWDQKSNQELLLTPRPDQPNDNIKFFDSEPIELDNQERKSDSKENTRCVNFDQTGSCVRHEKKPSGKSKATVSGMWYHPKKKKPLSSTLVKKFENIISKLLQVNEASFIEHDMDIKMAPRFYEVVKYPMCLHDISTKLNNSAYNEYEHVVQDFRRIFNNVRLYLKNFPDAAMKRNVSKISNEFEMMLNDEFKLKSQEEDNQGNHEADEDPGDVQESKVQVRTSNDCKSNDDDKK